MSKSTGINPSPEMQKFIREIVRRQSQKVIELIKERNLIPPFIEEKFDFYGELFGNKLWELDENGALRLLEENSPNSRGLTKIWPFTIKITDTNGACVEVRADDVRSTDIGLQIVFPDKRPFIEIKALAVQAFGEKAASSLQPNQRINLCDFLKPDTRTYEIILPECLDRNLERINEFLEGRPFSIVHLRWDGLPGPKVVFIHPTDSDPRRK